MAQSKPGGNIPLPPPMTGSNSIETGNSIGGRVVKVTSSGSRNTIVRGLFFVVYLFLRPITLPFSMVNYAFRQSRNITLVILSEVKKVGKLGFNVLELSLLMTKALNIITFKDGNTKPLMPRMMDVYNRMSDTLTDFHALPCTKEAGALGHLMLNRLPRSIWEKLLPYPHPFFRGSVTQATKTESNRLITSMETVPNDQYRPVPLGKKSK